MKLLASALALITVVAALGCARHDEQQIVFDSKHFYDSAQTTGDAFVYIAGTLTGDGVGYKNNTVAVTCYKDRMECLMESVEQIGPNQVGRLESPISYPITKWSAYEIVAADSTDTPHCRKTTISIVRTSQSAVWVEEPINQSSAECKDDDTRVRKWTIEDSPATRAMRSSSSG